MAFIAIEKHGGWEYATICTDTEGKVKVFDTLKEAWAEADNLQDGIVVGDEKVDVDGDSEAFLNTLNTNVEILSQYLLAPGVHLPKDVTKAVNNLIKLKSQVVA